VGNKVSRSVRVLIERHRARKPHPDRPLDAAREDNHAFRHAEKKVRRQRHEELMARQAEEKAAREAEQEKAAREAEQEKAAREAEQEKAARDAAALRDLSDGVTGAIDQGRAEATERLTPLEVSE